MLIIGVSFLAILSYCRLTIDLRLIASLSSEAGLCFVLSFHFIIMSMLVLIKLWSAHNHLLLLLLIFPPFIQSAKHQPVHAIIMLKIMLPGEE